MATQTRNQNRTGKKNRWMSVQVALAGAVIVAILFRYNREAHGYEEYLVSNMALLFWLPILLVVFGIRGEPSEVGFRLGDERRGYWLAATIFVIAFPVYFIAAKMPAFQSYYPIQKQAAYDAAYFAYFELTYGMYLFCWEFFFRGFLLFGLVEWLKQWSVLAQAVAFGVLHVGKPMPELVASFGSGIVLGMLALKSKSFLPCFVLHWASAVTFDVLVIMFRGNGLF